MKTITEVKISALFESTRGLRKDVTQEEGGKMRKIQVTTTSSQQKKKKKKKREEEHLICKECTETITEFTRKKKKKG